VDERLKAGRVSKQWRQELHSPSAWLDAGWQLTRHVAKLNALPMPAWLRDHLSAVRCSVNWLLYAPPFVRFCQLKNVRHLDLLLNDLKFDLAATDDAALRGHLSSLPLQSLRLSLPDSDDPLQRERDRHLLSVLTQPGPSNGAPSPLTKWSNSLTHLRCELRLSPDNPLLSALTARPWSRLCKVQLTLHCAGSPMSATALEQLHRSLLPSSMPALTWLELCVDCEQQEEDESCACNGWWTQLLPGVRTLTNLTLNFGYARQRVDLLELVRLISADALPQLTQLHLEYSDFLPLSSDARVAAIALLHRMPLAQLTHITHAGGSFQWLQHLPHLSVCTLTAGCCAESVAAAPSLDTLSCSADDIAGISEKWWRRCGCPPLQHASFVDVCKRRRHLTERSQQPSASATVPPVIRVLRCGPDAAGMNPLYARVFPYLAHLPQLRELECCLLPQDLRALGLLTQLKKLRLWLVVNTFWNCLAAMWSNGAMRTLGQLPLHRLHTLRLEGDDEFQSDDIASEIEEISTIFGCFKSDDPDFPCQ
jgi:hypothetical protein